MALYRYIFAIAIPTGTSTSIGLTRPPRRIIHRCKHLSFLPCLATFYERSCVHTSAIPSIPHPILSQRRGDRTESLFPHWANEAKCRHPTAHRVGSYYPPAEAGRPRTIAPRARPTPGRSMTGETTLLVRKWTQTSGSGLYVLSSPKARFISMCCET